MHAVFAHWRTLVNGPYVRGTCGLVLCMIAVACMTVFGNLVRALFLHADLTGAQGSLLGCTSLTCFIISVWVLVYSRDKIMNQTTLMGCIFSSLPALALICFLSNVSQEWMHAQLIPALIAMGILGVLSFCAGTQSETEQEERADRKKKQEAKPALAPELEEIIV